MTTVDRFLILLLLAGCDAGTRTCVELVEGTVLGSVPGVGLSRCANGADSATIQFEDGQIQTICATAQRGDVVKICRRYETK